VPIIPGHESVGRIDATGASVEGLRIGERVGVPRLGHTCRVCPYCMGGQENLCDRPRFTGYTRDGGFSTATIAMKARLTQATLESVVESLAEFVWPPLDAARDGRPFGATWAPLGPWRPR
jgi:D-arabinose 1-dehydrogenase-like Zn-dependent alcohol dehydrogenase